MAADLTTSKAKQQHKRIRCALRYLSRKKGSATIGEIASRTRLKDETVLEQLDGDYWIFIAKTDQHFATWCVEEDGE